VNERFALVDLPGYGFAVGPERERLGWGPLVEGYLRGRPTLRGVVLIVDVRRGLETEETQVLDFVEAVTLPAVVVATKLDKLSRSQARGALERLGGTPAVIGYSARTGEGRAALWRVVDGWVA